MSFLSRLGLEPVHFTEPAHGQVNTQLKLVIGETAVDIDSAVDKLMLDGNVFSSTEIVIAPGYGATIDQSSLSLINLFSVAQQPRVRIAQIVADGIEGFVAQDTFPNVGGNLALVAGTYKLVPDEDGEYLADFYFVSRL